MDHLTIAKNMLKSVDTGQLSAIKPQLDGHHIRLIGIGVDEVGVDDFVKGNFFEGELFIDINKKCYSDMKYKRFSTLSILKEVLSSSGRAGISKARHAGISGDFKGDGFQNGGTLVVSAGGEKCLLSYRQERAAEHVQPSQILEALGIPQAEVLPSNLASDVHCSDDVCTKN